MEHVQQIIDNRDLSDFQKVQMCLPHVLRGKACIRVNTSKALVRAGLYKQLLMLLTNDEKCQELYIALIFYDKDLIMEILEGGVKLNGVIRDHRSLTIRLILITIRKPDWIDAVRLAYANGGRLENDEVIHVFHEVTQNGREDLLKVLFEYEDYPDLHSLKVLAKGLGRNEILQVIQDADIITKWAKGEE